MIQLKLKDIDILLSKFLGGLNPREKIISLSAFFMVVLLLPFLLIFRPALEDISIIKQQLKARETELKLLETMAEVLNKKKDVQVDNKETWEYFRDFSELLGFIGQQARRHQLEIVSFFPGSSLENKGISSKISATEAADDFSIIDSPGEKKTEKNQTSTGTKSDQSGQNRVLAELKMQGSYNSIFNFFQEISQSQYLLGFQSMKIEKHPQIFPRLALNLVVVTVYAKD